MSGDRRQVEHYRARFEEFERGEGAAAPAWLRGQRREAFARFAELGFPTTRMEDWRYTSAAPVARLAFEPGDPGAARATRDEIEHLAFPLFACSLHVFVNGHFAPALSGPRPLARQVEVRSLRELLAAEPERLRGQLGAEASAKDQAFTALNSAFLADGALVRVPRGCEVGAPVHLVFVTVPGAAPSAVHPRVLVIAEEGSRAALIEDYLSLPGGPSLTNAVTEVVVGPNASLDHVKLQREGDEAFHVGALHVRQERSSRYASHAIALGAALTRNDLGVLLAGEGAECLLHGLFVGVGSQHVDNHTLIDHAMPHGTSRELYKGILGGRARGIFHGRIIVRPHAVRTDARQSNPNLLLSDQAEVNSKPQLEIHADDVRCTHGSTIGRLDEEALFYLRSRGLDEPTGRAVLTRAFASQIADAIAFEALRERIHELLLARLSGVREEDA